jgi:hypothetical protein
MVDRLGVFVGREIAEGAASLPGGSFNWLLWVEEESYTRQAFYEL